MTKILTWREEWTLHIDTLDEDHQGMVDLLIDLARRFGEETAEDAGASGGTDGNLFDALNRFGAFTRRHFQREEEFLRTIDYPGLPDHRSEHALLMAEFTALTRELRERGTERLGVQDVANLKQWVVAHILGADRGFADHYFGICGGDRDRL